MPIRYIKDKKCWRFEFNRKLPSGKRFRASKLLPKGWGENQAIAFDQQESARLYAVASGIEKPIPEIGEAVQIYLDHKIPHLKTGAKTAKELAFLIPYITGKRLDALGAIAKDFVKDNAHLAPATVKNRLAYLKSAVRYAYQHHDLGDRDYTDKMIMPTVNNKRHVYIQQGDFHSRLLAHCSDPETKAILTLAFYTGLRWRAEIMPLKPDQILSADGQQWISIPDSKNGTPHMIPVHPSASWALQFVPFKWSDSYHYHRFWEAREAAGLTHVKMHDQRHSFASALLSSGATLGEVGRAMNHKSQQSTQRYSHLYPERVKELIFRIPAAEKSAPDENIDADFTQ